LLCANFVEKNKFLLQVDIHFYVLVCPQWDFLVELKSIVPFYVTFSWQHTVHHPYFSEVFYDFHGVDQYNLLDHFLHQVQCLEGTSSAEITRGFSFWVFLGNDSFIFARSYVLFVAFRLRSTWINVTNFPSSLHAKGLTQLFD
jgi:hypothetical protein